MEMGLLAALGLMLAAPFAWLQKHAADLRFISQHEISLRRATNPIGATAVLGWMTWFLGWRTVSGALAPLLHQFSAYWPVAAALGALLFYGLASFVAGVCGCWGARSDPMLPVRALYRLAIGGGAFVFLTSNDAVRWIGPNFWTACGWLFLVIGSVWWIGIGASRFIFLTVGGSGSAMRTIQRQLKQKNAPLRPARRRWWQFWQW